MTVQAFCDRLQRACGVAPGSHVLAAVSGGADSVALLRLLIEARALGMLSVSCAHVEHGIRGEDSLQDLEFVRALCAAQDVPFFFAQVDAPAYSRAHGCGLEDAARTLRHRALQRIAGEAGADVIALAHHAGDQAETVLLHAMRGSDLRGLCAMRFRRGNLIRPLLDQPPQALRDYLDEMDQPYREDASNADRAFARNRVRLDVLPAMEQATSGAGRALCRLASAAQRDEDYFGAQLDAMRLPVRRLADGAAMEKRLLLGLHPALSSRAIVRLTAQAGLPPQRADAIEAILCALGKDESVVNLSLGAHAVIGRTHLSLVRAEEEIADTPLCVPGITDTPFGRFEVRPVRPGETGDGKTAQRIPERLLQGAAVGARRIGETMIPFGQSKPVKLKKLMIDAGIERALRRSVPIVRRGNETLFAVGLRPAQLCRAAEGEGQMLVRFLPEAETLTTMQEENSDD